MDNKSFNLVTKPWLKVIDLDTNRERTVSLVELFENAQNYRQLAGEMRSQDLAILRFLLAIVTTVYSRFDAAGEVYPWLKVSSQSPQTFEVDQDEFSQDASQEDLLETWQRLYKSGKFSEVVTRYLKAHADRFDFFGRMPFYQVTTEDYDALVPKKKSIAAGKGQVLVKQLNRRVSESANSGYLCAEVRRS